MTEVTWYPNGDDFGIHNRLVDEISEVLRAPENPETVNDMYGPRPDYSGWSEEDVTAYLQWLTAIVQRGGQEGPIQARQIDRASMIGLGGPTKATTMRILGETTITGVQKRIGQYETRSDFAHWHERDYVVRGKILADRIGNRPQKADIAAWHRERTFPSEAQILQRFGSLSRWHELIGYPRPTGWEVHDYAQWCAALYRVHPDLRVTNRVLDYYSSLGRGPGAWVVNKVVGGIPHLREVGQKMAAEYQYEYEVNESRALEHADMFRRGHPQIEQTMNRRTHELGETEFARAHARFMVLRKVASVYLPDRDYEENDIRSNAELWSAVQQRRPDAAYHQMMIASDILGVRELLWPSHRFANVDFTIPAELYNPKMGAPKKAR